MKISAERLLEESRQTGFRAEILEKVFHLLALLQGIARHPLLRTRLALKGGTALNLFYDDLPRLSVDADLNYIGATDRETMLAERPRVEEAITAVCKREGMEVRRVPSDHAGGKWYLRYETAGGRGGGNLEVDLNFMFRIPLWPVSLMSSHRIGSIHVSHIPVVDVHELAAGKLAALLSRHASRDLFDSHRLLRRSELDRAKLRLAFVVFGAMNRRDWRTVTPANVQFDDRELEAALFPVLSQKVVAAGSMSDWAKNLVKECRAGLHVVLPLESHELEFLERLLTFGEIIPELITSDPDMAERLQSHPGLQWKAANVRLKTRGK